MPETDEYADEQPDLVVRRVADPQDTADEPGEDTQGQGPGPQAQTRTNSMMTQGQM
ncbi:hypothetical protein [Streptomyces subrutilus]|uniref:hypothetical protein n=1 Tax=Streptomyces subrutilus TaxID=36818 RepID=UPI002E0FD104|nr:hypothetical protein OG479_06640 [Streptomyces subrutilus]